MILDEFMNMVEAPNLIISIGSKSAYFFIGTRAEYTEYIDLINEDFRNDLLETLRGYEVKASNLRSELKEDLFKKSPMKKIEDQRRYALQNLTTTLDKIEKLQKRIREFDSLREREIIQAYKRLDINDGLCVIVRGKEEGKYQLREEFIDQKEFTGMGNQSHKIRGDITLAKNLRKLREEAGLTVRQACEATGLSETTIRNFECAHTSPGIGAALAMADAYRCSLDKLYMREVK